MCSYFFCLTALSSSTFCYKECLTYTNWRHHNPLSIFSGYCFLKLILWTKFFVDSKFSHLICRCIGECCHPPPKSKWRTISRCWEGQSSPFSVMLHMLIIRNSHMHFPQLLTVILWCYRYFLSTRTLKVPEKPKLQWTGGNLVTIKLLPCSTQRTSLCRRSMMPNNVLRNAFSVIVGMIPCLGLNIRWFLNFVDDSLWCNSLLNFSC